MSLPGKWRTVLSYVLIFGLLAAVNLLPPDTSMSEVRAAGVLRACLPTVYPPLVTGDPAAPGSTSNCSAESPGTWICGWM
jgi:hypothetical protein